MNGNKNRYSPTNSSRGRGWWVDRPPSPAESMVAPARARVSAAQQYVGGAGGRAGGWRRRRVDPAPGPPAPAPQLTTVCLEIKFIQLSARPDC